MDKPWKVILAFICVFIAGAVFGSFFTARTASQKLQETQPVVTAVTPSPAPATTTAATAPATTPPANRPNNANVNRGAALLTPIMLQRLATQLKLTDEQKEKVQPSIKRASDDMNYLRAENFRATNRVLERMHAEIALVLTPEQKSELEVQKRIIEDRMKQAEKQLRQEQLLRREQKNNPASRVNTQDAALKGN